MQKIFHKTLRISIFAFTAAIFITSCAPRTETIWIISTNDMHGNIEKFPNLATLVNSYRAQDTASVFLLDAGDRWTGNAYVDMAAEPGLPIIELMNTLEYDAATFGNHEFDWGQEILAKRVADADFPIVLANMQVMSSPMQQPQPYAMLQSKGKTRIGVLGLITNFTGGHPDGTDEVYEGLIFDSPYSTAKAYSWLRKESDLFIALTHIGYHEDVLLATEVPDFDIIIGGHTHTLLPGAIVVEETEKGSHTYITQTENKLKYAGVTKITMHGKKVVDIDNSVVKLDTVAPDPLYSAIVEHCFSNEELKRPIGSMATTANQDGVANLVTDLARRQMKTDLAFYHIGGIRVPELPKGNISKANIAEIDPFASTVVVVEMTLPQIRDMVINKYNDTENAKESHRPDIYPSGLTYTIVTDEKGEAVDVVFDNLLQKKSGKYSVAIADYMYKRYQFDKSEITAVSPLLTDIMLHYFESSASVKPDNKSRISIRH